MKNKGIYRCPIKCSKNADETICSFVFSFSRSKLCNVNYAFCIEKMFFCHFSFPFGGTY